eukprot:CAMPEP_0116966828 /NCGR_PEP_ID=MMETSP0467-20121206/50132_1 /TAXON_ID=283647 /ORGANISM="Mesodinium pulex, Strain SPMC105" /LENGTH=43 /DNA_ID= /DNA_START= /DNA_END= /DNA_ORIENTATION=
MIVDHLKEEDVPYCILRTHMDIAVSNYPHDSEGGNQFDEIEIQ